MNATSKLTQFREFRANLNAVAAALGATAVHTARMDEGVFTVTLKSDSEISFGITYTNYEYHGAPRLYIDRVGYGQAMLKNLSRANLTKHLGARIAEAKQHADEIAEDKRKDRLTYAAEKTMADALTAELKHDGFTKLHSFNYPAWHSSSLGEIRLTNVTATKNTEGNYDITYNVEYDFNVSGVVVKGELDAPDLAGIRRTLKALYSL